MDPSENPEPNETVEAQEVEAELFDEDYEEEETAEDVIENVEPISSDPPIQETEVPPEEVQPIEPNQDELDESKPSTAEPVKEVPKKAAGPTIEEQVESLKDVYVPSSKRVDPRSIKLTHSFGFPSHKRSNIHLVEENKTISAMGNILILMDLKNNDLTYVQGLRNGSIGAMAVHPSKQFIAVAENASADPIIFIYSYPEFKITKILRGGAEKGYSDICFNASGTRLASVATEPDYMLTIWNWEDSQILLRSKAFSQDVYRVNFAKENDGVLTTSGMGHIKFWKMSSTFTGLKLQGYIGKFGASELTDIEAFVQLPDGKVLSSTETGNLLLWDGGMIKCEIGVKGKKPCHTGRIETILLTESEVLTGGEDGLFKIWDLETIDNADVASVTGEGSASSAVSIPRVFEMEAIDEILIGKDIKNIVKLPTNSEYLIQDSRGHLIKLDLNKRSTEKILSFHSKGVAASVLSPLAPQLVTLGVAGSLRVYNYISKELVNKSYYASGGSYLMYVPTLLDPLAQTVVAGFEDGTIRFISTTSLVLQFVFKPHKEAVTAICFSKDGKYMITASKDKSIFIFDLALKDKKTGKIQQFSKSTITIKPKGFTALESEIQHISFSETETPPKKNSNESAFRVLYITLENGLVYTAHISDKFIDTSTSYEIEKEKLNVQQFKFTVPKKVVEVKEAESEEKEEGITSTSKTNLADTAPLSNSLNSIRKRTGLNITDESPISFVTGLVDHFFLCVVRNESHEYEIRLGSIAVSHFSKLYAIYTDKVTKMTIDGTRQVLLLGFEHGTCATVRFNFDHFATELKVIPTLHEDYEMYCSNLDKIISDAERKLKETTIEELQNAHSILVEGQQWSDHLHDLNSGRVTGVDASFDFAFMVSCGLDGGIFLRRNIEFDVENTEQETLPEDIPDQFTLLEDITDKNAYSIQEEKLKAERDIEIQKAEVRKQDVRNAIQDLRNQFNSLVQENSQSDPSVRIERQKMLVDPYLHADMEKDAVEKKELLLKELAWTAEKEAIGPKKLFNWFLKPLQTERIKVAAIKNGMRVSTFRTLKLDEFIESILEPLNAQLERKLTTADSGAEEASNRNIKKKESISISKKGDSKATKNLRHMKKLEARKQQRAERAAQWKELMDSKPDDKYQDPKDVAAIRYAIANMGDFKLKTADDYIVPESERVDADKKRRQIALLTASVSALQEEFNLKVIALRDEKVALVEEFKIGQKQLNVLKERLEKLNQSIDCSLKIPTLEAFMFPENRSIVTEADIEELQQQEQEAQGATKMGDGIGFGNSEPSRKQQTTMQSPDADTSNVAELTIEELASRKPVPSTPGTNSQSKYEIYKENEIKCQKVKLQYDVDQIKKKLENRIEKFDESVSMLAKERLILAGDLKFADIKLQLLFKEWVLLKEFEHTDNALAEKLDTKKVEKNEIEAKIAEYKDKLDSKKAEIDAIIVTEREILDEYRQIIGENNKHEEYLTKVFKRKIKRVKKKTTEEGDGEGDEEEEEEEEESDASSYNSEDDENNEFEEACPTELDANIWQRVLEVREKRLDAEEMLAEVQKSVELLKKENDAFLKKDKIIESALKNTKVEIQEFQTQKQRKLNELDVVVPLKISQIQHLVNDQIPQDLSTSLVFFNEGLTQLRKRINELKAERVDIKKQHRELKKQHVSFIKSKKEKQAKVIELTAKNREVQMLKFGQIVDLEKLERLGVNKAADELKEKMQKDEQRRTQEVLELEKLIAAEKRRLMDIVKENTQYLEDMVEFQQKRIFLETALNHSQKCVNADLAGPPRKEMEERKNLINLVKSQAQQIDALKAEIEFLVRKPIAKNYLPEPMPVKSAPPKDSRLVEISTIADTERDVRYTDAGTTNIAVE